MVIESLQNELLGCTMVKKVDFLRRFNSKINSIEVIPASVKQELKDFIAKCDL